MRSSRPGKCTAGAWAFVKSVVVVPHSILFLSVCGSGAGKVHLVHAGKGARQLDPITPATVQML